MIEDEAYPNSNIKLYPCDICGRNFQQESLVKHRNICKKTSTKNRKIFDSGRQRAEGSDVIYSKTKETKKVQILGQKAESDGPQSNWREKHNEFIKTVRNARIVSEAIKTGAPLPKFEASAVPSDYVNCQFCGRNFSSGAAERHIPFCEQQSKRQKKNNSAQNQKPKPKIPLPGQKKVSTDAQYGQYGQFSSDSASLNSNGRQGYQSGISNKGFTSGNDRKPIKYDSNLYYESDSQDTGAIYAMKNKAAALTNKTKQEQILRTGRNTTNSELNNAIAARNRGHKESPMNSRDPSKSRYGNQPSPNHTQNGQRNMQGGYGRQISQPAVESPVATSKFCHECGSEFPVKWARFCSFCGDRRL